jgi:[ribosomal protein S18]-alanine N-acetyltransferase
VSAQTWWMRPAVAADAAVVAGLEAEIFGPDAWSLQAVRDELAAADEMLQEPDASRPAAERVGSRAALVLLTGEQVVGYAFLRTTVDVAEVLRIAVQPGLRRHGGGTNLMESLLDFARRRQCLQVLLEVAADNKGAQAFYAQLGFAVVHRRPRYYHRQVDALVLERRI